MNSLRQRRQQVLREEILTAAHELLSKKGYASMSMDDLAMHVGISKPTLYSYFGTKDELIATAFTREVQALTTMIESEHATETPLQRLSLLLRTIVEKQIHQQTLTLRPIMPDLFHLIRNNTQAMEAVKQLDTTVTALIQEGMDIGEIDPALDRTTLAHAFYSLTSVLKYALLDESYTPDPEQLTNTLVTFFLNGVQSQAKIDLK
ncbi:MAG: TetR/AcrR family transcriptional regulator [Chloroflexota bacterium]